MTQVAVEHRWNLVDVIVVEVCGRVGLCVGRRVPWQAVLAGRCRSRRRQRCDRAPPSQRRFHRRRVRTSCQPRAVLYAPSVDCRPVLIVRWPVIAVCGRRGMRTRVNKCYEECGEGSPANVKRFSTTDWR